MRDGWGGIGMYLKKLRFMKYSRYPNVGKNPDSGDLKTGQNERFSNGKVQNI